MIIFFLLFNFGKCLKLNPSFRYKSIQIKDDFTTACDLCKNSVTVIKHLSDLGCTMDEIQVSILAACSLYSGKSREVCDSIASTYFPIFYFLQLFRKMIYFFRKINFFLGNKLFFLGK